MRNKTVIVAQTRTPPSQSGFTLVEMAVVIVIMGLVMMTVLPALNTVRSANQQALTQSNLRSLLLATAAFTQANGCLPCPAVPGNTGTNFGKLGYYTATKTPSPTIACGICTNAVGIPPFAHLGIPASTAHDGWGHWITMRVDPALTKLPVNNPPNCSATNSCPVYVPPQAPCTENDVTNKSYTTCTQSGTSSKGLCATGLPKTDSVLVNTPTGASQYAAVIFVSHGKTGYGSYAAEPKASGQLTFPSNYAACSASGGYARCNASTDPKQRQFYDAPIAVQNNDPYDDVLAYADRNTLVSMFGNGACSTAW